MEEQAESLLKELGMSEYETKACMVLVKFGSSDANKIASIGNIPLPRVYDTMENLAKRGLISISRTRPQTFSIISLKRFFEILKLDEKKKIEEKIKSIDDVSSKFFKEISSLPSVKAEGEKEDTILFMKRRINVGEIWDEIQGEANKEFLVFAGDLSWINVRYNDIVKMTRRGIKYKVIWFKSEREVVPNVKKAMKSGAELRLYDDSSNEFRGLIADGEKVYVIQKVPKLGIDMKNLKEGIHWSEEVADYNGIILNNKTLAKVFRDYFYLLWEKSMKSENFLQKFK